MLAKLYISKSSVQILEFFIMKAIYIIFFSLLATTSLLSQITYDTSYTLQWNCEKDIWEISNRIITSYDESMITSELIQLYENDRWINYNFRAYDYNRGRIIRESDQFWNDSKLRWEDDNRKLYDYDKENKLVQIIYQNVYKRKYYDTSIELLIYSHEGKLKEKIIKTFEEAWSNYIKYQYYISSDYLLTDENLT